MLMLGEEEGAAVVAEPRPSTAVHQLFLETPPSTSKKQGAVCFYLSLLLFFCLYSTGPLAQPLAEYRHIP